MSLSAGVEYDDNVTVSLQDLATGLDDFAYILEDTASKVLLCPGLAYWDHLDPVLDRLHQLKRIIKISTTNHIIKFPILKLFKQFLQMAFYK